MPAIKPTCISDLKLRVNIVDVVARTVTLRKAGSRFKGLCPFHREKSPSFHVNPDAGFYKCFGCGQAGDIITFVRETEQLNFTEAVEALGQRFNVPIEYEEGSGPTREERSLRQELFDLHDIAADYYHECFHAPDEIGRSIRTYWEQDRGFGLEIASEFKIGLARPQDGGLAALLLRKKFSEDALRQCGLFFIYDNQPLTLGALRPRFRGRLMIPIRDHQGRVVAFTARQTKHTPEDDPAREAKYVNSPETPIFTKGNLLFNLDRARKDAGEGHPFVMVEGQLDAIRLWSAGLKTAIAPQGTAITEGQLLLLRRYHPEIECFFDGDSAGQKAALRFLPLALRVGHEVRFLGRAGDIKLDPDDLFRREGIAAYETLKAEARSAMAFACSALLPADQPASPDRVARATQEIFAIINQTESSVIRSGLLQEAARLWNVNAAALLTDFERFLSSGRQSASPTPVSDETVRLPPAGPTHSPERDLLLLVLHFEEHAKTLSHSLPMEWIDSTQVAGRVLNRILAEFEHDTWPGRDNMDHLLADDAEKKLVADLRFEEPKTDDPLKNVSEGMNKLRQRTLTPRLRQIELALSTPQQNGDRDALSLLKERAEIQRQLRQPLRLVPDL